MIISLEILLEEIDSEPVETFLTAKEKRFINEVEYLKEDNIDLYIKYWTRYEVIRNKKFRDGF